MRMTKILIKYLGTLRELLITSTLFTLREAGLKRTSDYWLIENRTSG